MVRHVALPLIGTVQTFRDAARAAMSEGIAPEGLTWSRGAGGGDLLAGEPPRGALRRPVLGKAALDELMTALAHGDRERFALAYGLLWRIAGGELRWGDRTDPAMLRLMRMAKAVRRDVHKMHAFVRFREVEEAGARRRFAAFFEPEHPVTEAAASFFARRFGDMDWIIVTPEVTARFEAGALSFHPTDGCDLPRADAAEALWLTYYRSIFNPARLMVKAMQAEMPKKYWRNLPEAELIPRLVRGAAARVEAMAVAEAPARRAEAARAMARRDEVVPPGDLATLAAEARDCRRCGLCEMATQVVFGEGPQDAPMMVVGEQPGDHEDLAGRPFVGPAGQLLRAAAGEADLDLDTAYLTNAVKHFKFVPKGKRRLHQNPSVREVDHCRWWLRREREVIRPPLTLALGGTALLALTGDGRGVTARRGRLERAEDGLPVFSTVHPAMILRLPRGEQDAARAAFVKDLAQVAVMVKQLRSVS